MIAFSFLLNFGAFLKFPQGSGHLPSALFHKAKMLSSHISRTAFVESGPEEGVEAPANCLRSRFAVVGVVPIVSLRARAAPVWRGAYASPASKCDCSFFSSKFHLSK